MSERFQDWSVRRSAGWPPGQAARADLGTFRASPVIQYQSLGPICLLAAQGASAKSDWPSAEPAQRGAASRQIGDACAGLIRASLVRDRRGQLTGWRFVTAVDPVHQLIEGFRDLRRLEYAMPAAPHVLLGKVRAIAFALRQHRVFERR